MNTGQLERFVVRPRFWPAWLFFTLAMQLLCAITVLICVAIRFIMSQPLFGWDDAQSGFLKLG